MAQITWRNIDAPSFAGSNQAAQAGADSISRGLASLGTLAQQEGKRRKDVNTGELLREIQGLDTAGLAQARSSGQFGADALAGQNVDEGALFAALKGQDAAIAKQTTDVFNRENTARTQSDAPILAASQAELAGISDPKKIAAYTAKLGESGLSSQAQTQMLNAAKAAETSLVSKGRVDETYRRNKAALDREDVNRRQQEESDAAITASLAGEAGAIAQNKTVVSQVAEKLDLQLDENGQFISPGFSLPDIKNPKLREMRERHAQEKFDRRLKKELKAAGLSQPKTQVEQEKVLQKSFVKSGLSPSETATAMTNFRALKPMQNSLPQPVQAALATDIANATATIDLNMQQARDAHQTLVDSNPTTQAETERQKSITVNKVLAMAVDKAPEGSWLNLEGDSAGIGGEALRTKIIELSKKSYDGNPVEPWMIETALLANTQTTEEAWGNPVTGEEGLELMVKILAKDTSGARRKELISQSKTKLAEAELASVLAKTNQARNLTVDATKRAGTFVPDYSKYLK